MNPSRLIHLCLLIGLTWSPITFAQESREGMSADKVAKESANANSSLASPSAQEVQESMSADEVAEEPANPNSSLAAPAAQEAHEGMSADEVAKELANPTSSLASLTFKNQLRLYQGDLPGANSQANYTTLFQPVFPFTLPDTASGGKKNLFIRPAFPILFGQPIPSLDESGSFSFDHDTQIGDIGFDIALGATEPDGLIYALGMVGTLPTATSKSVAGGQLRLGPEMFVGKAWDKGLVGIFPNHQWDVAGWNDSAFSTTQVQPFLKILPGDGWSIGTLPIIDYNWETDEWTAPINLTIGKTLKIGDTPWKIELDANYYFESPNAFGPEWMIGLNITPVVPNFIEKLIRGK